MLDDENNGVPKHLGEIADTMCEWEGKIAEQLCLMPAEVENIKCKCKDNLKLQK